MNAGDRCTYDDTCTLHPGDASHGYRHCPECGNIGACKPGCAGAGAPVYQVEVCTGVSRPAFSPSGQMWDWTPRSSAGYLSLSEAVAAAYAIAPADGLMVTLCRYPAPDRQTAPCMAQRIGMGPWKGAGGITRLSELLKPTTAAPAKLRVHSVFEPCDAHAGLYAGLGLYRRAECMVEGGIGGPCPGPKCRMKPGTDFYAADFVAANPVYYVGT